MSIINYSGTDECTAKRIFERDALFRQLFETSADANLLLEGDVIIACNDAAVRLLCYQDKTELCAIHPSKLSPQKQPDGSPSREQEQEWVAEAINQGSVRFEWVHQRRDGQPLPTEVLLTAIPFNGQVVIHSVLRDITERKQVSQTLQTAVAAERSRLARELHDSVTQTLFSASLIAEVLPRLWDRDQAEARRRLNELRELTRGASAEMRTLLLELRPVTLAEASLAELLHQLTEATIGRARIPIDLQIKGDQPLPTNLKTALYRITQEALNNVIKHAVASKVEVALYCQSGRVTLSISDDGKGFHADQISEEHLGLGIMYERAAAVLATLKIDSQVGQGTRIVVTWTASDDEASELED